MFDGDRKSTGFIKTFLIALLTSLGVGVILIFGASGYIIRGVPENQQTPQLGQYSDAPKPQQISIEQRIDTDETNIIQRVAKSATPGVVGISVLKMDSSSIFDRNTSENWGIGSGVIVSPDGYIVTNSHVAGGQNKRIVVSLADGRNVEGVTVWFDPVLDLAVVKIEADNIVTVPLGDANNLQVGDMAIAIGNPLGLQFQRTVTSGIISALNRTIKIEDEQGTNYMEDLVQTDASINPGNSGGPLLNSKGEVIGINTVKVASAEGIGFAIPINVAAPIVKKFASTGKFLEPYLGVFAYDKEVIPYINSNVNLDSGIYIADIDQKGPAYKNGIRIGCIITHMDNKEINTMMQLRSYIYSKNPGDEVVITCLYNGNTETKTIKLAAKEKEGLVTR